MGKALVFLQVQERLNYSWIPKMKKLPLILCLLLGFGTATVYGQLFIQDFSASTTVGDYVNASPDNTQFTYIGGTGVVFSINSGMLQMVRSGGNAGYVTRNASFTPTPGLLKVVFDLEVPTASGNTSSAAIFRFGQGYGNDNNTPPNSNTHSRIGINLVAGGGFQLRDIDGATNSSTYSGIETVTWWINNSGSSATYTGPDGGTQTLANDRNDVWVGSDLAFNDMNSGSLNANASLSHFKINFDNGTGTIRFDNFLITTEASLPVELSRFDSRLIRKQAHLSWATESETDNDYFAVERSADGRQYTEIGRVSGAGTTREPQTYGFVDAHPQKGLNYYRLRQVDLDSRQNFSPVRVVSLDEWLDVRLFPSPAAAWLELNWSEPVESVITWQILDPAGRQIESGLLPEAGTRSTLALQHLAPGSYLLRLSDGQRSWSQIFLKN